MMTRNAQWFRRVPGIFLFVPFLTVASYFTFAGRNVVAAIAVGVLGAALFVIYFRFVGESADVPINRGWRRHWFDLALVALGGALVTYGAVNGDVGIGASGLPFVLLGIGLFWGRRGDPKND